jgi:hypothetical protein
MVSISKLGSSSFFFFFFLMDKLEIIDVTLILGADMNADVPIETHMKYYKLLILRKKVTEEPI